MGAWVAAALFELEDSDFVQDDIDDLFEPPPRLAARAILECLKTAVQVARTSRPDLDGIAVIPLEAVQVLSLEAPSWNLMLDQDWEYGPGREVPGLYLVKPAIWRHQADLEEYRQSVDVSSVMGPGFAGYYRCWRSAEDAGRGWEYSRDFYVRTSTG
jgi:hypothetical protein